VVLTLDPETRQVSAGPSRQEADEGQAEKAILDYLNTLDEPADEATLQEAVEGRKATKQRALRVLVKAGSVCRMGGGKRGDPYRYISSSHAPATHGEPEKHQLHTDATNDQDAADSASRDGLTTGASSETWEPKPQRLEEVSP
jgi:hypothetical protein